MVNELNYINRDVLRRVLDEAYERLKEVYITTSVLGPVRNYSGSDVDREFWALFCALLDFQVPVTTWLNPMLDGLRLEIEEMVGRLAADNISDGYLQQLSSLLDQCGKLVKSGDKASLMRIDTQLRTILNNCANNPILKNISESLYDITVRLWCGIIDQGNWEEEVQLVYNEIDQTISVLKKPEKQLGALRREILSGQIQRISQKFLGGCN